MGYLYYGAAGHGVEIEDRPLAHLKVALLTVLRAGHSVALSHPLPVGRGSGRETLWIAPSAELRFKFQGSRPPKINERWVAALIDTAASPTGMYLMLEPPPE